MGSIPGLGRSSGGGNNPLQYFLPGKLHGQMSLAGNSSTEGHKKVRHDQACTHTQSNKSPHYSISSGIFLYHICMFSMKDLVYFL